MLPKSKQPQAGDLLLQLTATLTETISIYDLHPLLAQYLNKQVISYFAYSLLKLYDFGFLWYPSSAL